MEVILVQLIAAALDLLHVTPPAPGKATAIPSSLDSRRPIFPSAS